MPVFDSFVYKYNELVPEKPTALACQHAIRDLIITLEHVDKTYPTSNNAVVAAKMWHGLSRCDAYLPRMQGPLGTRRLDRLSELRCLDADENHSNEDSMYEKVVKNNTFDLDQKSMTGLRREMYREIGRDLDVLYSALTLKSRVLHLLYKP
jgi:hypothetical protein